MPTGIIKTQSAAQPPMAAFQGSHAGMPAFLLLAAFFNLRFFARSLKDVFHSSSPLSGSPAVALLLLATAQLIWVLSCLVQCMLVFFGGGDADWSPKRSIGCDIQGFYSVLGSVGGMLATMLLVYQTLLLSAGAQVWQAAPPVWRACWSVEAG
jgi:hypothetical protein